MDSSERGMNPIVMTIIILGKILAELGMEPATSCSQVIYTTDWAMACGKQSYARNQQFSP